MFKTKVEAAFAVYSMANVPQRVYRLPLPHDVKFNILQPGDKKLSHAPRVKVFRNHLDGEFNFSVSLDENPELVAGNNFLNGVQLRLVLDHIKKYRTAYLMLWHDDAMDIDELRIEMDKIDAAST